MNLSSNSGTNLENVTISWATTNETMQIKDELGLVIDEISEDSYDFNDMDPGEFRDIFLEIEVAGTTYSDDIQIFTRSVNPVTNFTCTTNEIVEYDNRYDDGEFFYDYIPDEGNNSYDHDVEHKENFIEGNGIYDGPLDDSCICTNNAIPDDCAECYIDTMNNKYDADDNEIIIENGIYDGDDDCICSNNDLPNGCK